MLVADGRKNSSRCQIALEVSMANEAEKSASSVSLAV